MSYSSRRSSRKSARRAWAPASPGVQTSAKPSAQSGASGRSAQEARSSVGGGVGEACDASRGGQGVTHLRTGGSRAPIRREDLERSAGLGLDLPGLAKELGVEAFRCDPGLGQGLGDCVVGICRVAVAAVPVHGGRVHLARQSGDGGQGRSAPEYEASAALPDIGGQRLETMVQPPARGAATLPDTLVAVVEHIDADDRLAPLHARMQRAIVGETQILAEPDDGRSALLGHGVLSRCCRRYLGRSWPGQVRSRLPQAGAPTWRARPAR